jgi:predicted phosphate transport protein (TIGR00153 family)
MFNNKPKEDKFYIMFSDLSKNVNEAALILKANLNSLNNKDIDVNNTKKCEDKGDELVRNVIKELNEAFITPIDREDIYEIITEMDNILDLINSTMHRFIMFNIEECTDGSRQIGDLLVQATTELVAVMDELRTKGYKSKKISEQLSNISKFESEADKIFRITVAKLFRTEKDPFTVMKWKEIYQILENTIDNCEKVAKIVEGVVIKNA